MDCHLALLCESLQVWIASSGHIVAYTGADVGYWGVCSRFAVSTIGISFHNFQQFSGMKQKQLTYLTSAYMHTTVKYVSIPTGSLCVNLSLCVG